MVRTRLFQPRRSLVSRWLCQVFSGLGLVQVYALTPPERSGRCLPTCTDWRHILAPLAGYELKRPYICRLTMGGLKTREWDSYKPGLITSTDPNSHLLTRSFAELAQSVRSVTIRSVFGSHAAVPIPEASRESLVVCQMSQVSAWFRFTL